MISLHARLRGEALRRTVHETFSAVRPLEPDTDFFAAGFTSSLLTDVVARLGEQGVEVGLIDVYAYPTVRELTGALNEARSGGRNGAGGAPPWLTGDGRA